MVNMGVFSVPDGNYAETRANSTGTGNIGSLPKDTLRFTTEAYLWRVQCPNSPFLRGPYNYIIPLLFVFTIIFNKTFVWPDFACLLTTLDNCCCRDIILRNFLFSEWTQNTFRLKRV